MFFFQVGVHVTESRSLRAFSAYLHKKVILRFLRMYTFTQVVTGECCVFEDRPVAQSPSRLTGETTAVVLGCISGSLTLTQMSKFFVM